MRFIRRIGAIGDIHSEDDRLDRALSYLQPLELDLIVSTGDLIDGPGSVDLCCELLRSNQVLAVRGNHDRWFLRGQLIVTPIEIREENRDYLNSLPVTREFQTPRGMLLLCHGLGSNDMAVVSSHGNGYALESNEELHSLMSQGKYRFTLNGHSHHPLVRHFQGLTIINAGTLLREHTPGFLTLDFEKGIVEFFEFAPDLSIRRHSEQSLVTPII